jgi:hypothetical protein
VRIDGWRAGEARDISNDVNGAHLTGLIAALLVASCSTRTEVKTQRPDGAYPNAIVEGRTVPMVHVKDNGATVLVDTEGKVPRIWAEQYRRQGDLPEGTYNIHKTHVAGHESFADIPVDRKGLWSIDAAGTITAVAFTGAPPDGFYANVTVEGRKVPMIHVKDGGATVLVDTEGKVPRTWAAQFRRRGDVPNGTYDIHKTHVEGHENFRDLPVDRKGIWTIDAAGNVTAH